MTDLCELVFIMFYTCEKQYNNKPWYGVVLTDNKTSDIQIYHIRLNTCLANKINNIALYMNNLKSLSL